MTNYAAQIARLGAGESLEISRDDFRASITDPIERVAYLPLARRLAAQAGCNLDVQEESMVFRKKPPKS